MVLEFLVHPCPTSVAAIKQDFEILWILVYCLCGLLLLLDKLSQYQCFPPHWDQSLLQAIHCCLETPF